MERGVPPSVLPQGLVGRKALQWPGHQSGRQIPAHRYLTSIDTIRKHTTRDQSQLCAAYSSPAS